MNLALSTRMNKDKKKEKKDEKKEREKNNNTIIIWIGDSSVGREISEIRE